jgi:uncharacterized C2H2 Zn-finger protein
MKLRYYAGKLTGIAETLEDMKLLMEVSKGKVVSDHAPRGKKDPTPSRQLKKKGKGSRPGSSAWVSCSVCGRIFRGYKTLNNHLRIAHGITKEVIAPSKLKRIASKPDLPCPICGKVKKGYHALANHLRMVHGLQKKDLHKKGIYLGRGYGDKRYTGKVITNYLDDNSAEAEEKLAEERKGWIEV